LCSIDYGIRKKARMKCRRFYAGQVAYSDVIGQARREIHLWNLVTTHRLKRRVDTRKIRRLMAQTGQHEALQYNIHQVQLA